MAIVTRNLSFKSLTNFEPQKLDGHSHLISSKDLQSCAPCWVLFVCLIIFFSILNTFLPFPPIHCSYDPVHLTDGTAKIFI